MIVVTQNQTGQTIDMRVDEVIELRLPENPSTGFRWALTSPGAPVCAIVGDSFRLGGSAPGAPGEHRWEIRGVRPGTCDVSLAYRRGFDHVAPARSFTLRLRVAG